MSIFRKLFGNRGPQGQPPSPPPRETTPAVIHESAEARVLDGSTDLNVVGEASYQENLWAVVGEGRSKEETVRVQISALLTAETDNPYDTNAISVWINGLRVGYLSREDAARYRPGLLALQNRMNTRIALRGAIVGGGIRDDGPGRLGVFLRHDPTDFGLRHRVPLAVAGTTMRTGMTEAIASDAADDSYDLGWVADLPSDPLRAISMLRRLLENETDPIDRHFMFHNLEESLYKSREIFAAALDEFDECCIKHDLEMDTIRSAFMKKWGKVPWLHTYGQMCIRMAKAKRFEDALRWAERGISVYGEDAARPDAVSDLLKRAAGYRTKLLPPEVSVSRVARTNEPQEESLTCARCGRTFGRLRSRGRKPTLCQDCRQG